MNNQKMRILGVLCIVLFFIYMKNNGPNNNTYSADGDYNTIGPMKHDIFKQLTVDLLPVIILSLATRDEIWNWDKPLQTVLGQSLLAGLGYVIFYQVIEPYLVTKVPKF